MVKTHGPSLRARPLWPLCNGNWLRNILKSALTPNVPWPHPPPIRERLEMMLTPNGIPPHVQVSSWVYEACMHCLFSYLWTWWHLYQIFIQCPLLNFDKAEPKPPKAAQKLAFLGWKVNDNTIEGLLIPIWLCQQQKHRKNCETDLNWAKKGFIDKMAWLLVDRS